MSFPRRITVLLCAFALCASAAADERPFGRGFPLIRTYTQKQHSGGSQLFGVAQDRAGILYFGALKGVASYDGASWRVVALPNESAVYAVASRNGPEIAAGAVNELGWVSSDERGGMTYHSLLPQLPQQFRNVGDVRSICTTPQGYVYTGDHSIIVWNGGAPQAIEAAVQRCFTAGASVYLAGRDGLQRFDSSTMTISRAGFDGKEVELVLPLDGARIAVAVRGEGLFVSDGVTVTPFAPDATAWLKGKLVTAGCVLRDGRLVVGTRHDGVVILTQSGEVEQRLETSAGLPEEVLAAAHADQEGALWLAYHGSLTRVDLASPVSLVDARSGLHGAPSSIVRHRGRTFITTSHGLFVNDGAPPKTLRLIEGVAPTAWRAISLDDELLVATADGLYLLGDDLRPRRIEGTQGLVFYRLLRSDADPSRVWVSGRKGLGTLRRDGGSWRFEGFVPGTTTYVREMVEHDGILWAATTFDGTLRVDPRTLKITKFGEGEMDVTLIDGALAFIRKNTLLELTPDGRFVRHRRHGHISGNFFHVAQDRRGNLWTNSTPPHFYARLANGAIAREPLRLGDVDAANIQVVFADDDGIVWFCGDQVLYRHEAPAAVAQPVPRISTMVAGPLPHSFGRLRIEFAPRSYRSGVAYQYRLDPADAQWSEWTSVPSVDYTTLDAGQYTFRLRARSATGVSEEALWSFEVQPPWYRRAWALALWVLLAALLVAAIVRIRTAALRIQASRLRALVEERTAELRQAIAQLERLSLLDELTGIANRRYFQRALGQDWNVALENQQPVALILIDLDHFKALNDERGHPAGDEALIKIGRYLSRQIRRSGDTLSRMTNIVARIGGEEFAVLLLNTSAEEATAIAEHLRAGIESLGLGVTASCGVAAVRPRNADQSNTLIGRADRALYAAKAAGRNCVRIDEGTEQAAAS